MAEARFASLPPPSLLLRPTHTFAHHVFLQGSFGYYGITIFIPYPRYWLKGIFRFLRGVKRKLQNAVSPLPLWFVASLEIGLTACVVRSSPGGVQKTRFAQAIGKIGSRIPLTNHLPQKAKVALATATTSMLGLGVLTLLNRIALRCLLTQMDWLDYRTRKTLKVKLWAIAMRCLLHGKQTYSLQSSLPAQPLPHVADTVSQYLLTMEPLLSPKEFDELSQDAKQFVEKESIPLQRYLHFRHLYRSNYMSDWWEEAVYLRNRRSLMLGSNYGGLPVGHDPVITKQSVQAACVMHALMELKLQLDREELPPVILFNTVPLCMAQYRHALATTREPHPIVDKIRTYKSSRHFVILYRGRFFKISCRSKETGRALTYHELELAVQSILQAPPSTEEPPEAHLAALTALDRDEWTRVRDEFFIADRVNQVALHTIESAVAFINLSEDEFWYDQFEANNRAGLHGTGDSLWFDKSLCLTISKNTITNISGEHSWGDAIVPAYLFELLTARLLERIDKGTLLDKNGHLQLGPDDTRSVDWRAERLLFHISPELSREIETAFTSAKALAATCDIVGSRVEGIGAATSKKLGCSPDAFVQMAIQLAFFRDQNHFTQTYESGMLRFFVEGRTETIRTVSHASCAFVHAMENTAASEHERLQLLRAACEYHTDLSIKCMKGYGADRHLFALYVVATGTETTSKFLDTFIRTPWKLSTSQIPYAPSTMKIWPLPDQPETHPMQGGSFAPVSDDGYGVSYVLQGRDRVIVHVSANNKASNTSAQRMLERIQKALGEMAALSSAL